MFSSPQIRENPQAGQTTGNKHPEIPSWPYTWDGTHATKITAHKCIMGLLQKVETCKQTHTHTHTHTSVLLCIHKGLVNKYTHHRCHSLHHRSRPKEGPPDAPAANTGATLGGPPCITNMSPRVSHGTRPRVEVLMRLWWRRWLFPGRLLTGQSKESWFVCFAWFFLWGLGCQGKKQFSETMWLFALVARASKTSFGQDKPMFPGRRSGFRAGNRPDSNRNNLNVRERMTTRTVIWLKHITSKLSL